MLQVIVAVALVLVFLGPALAAFAEDDSGRADYDILAMDRYPRES
jgi:hypothetical protein